MDIRTLPALSALEADELGTIERVIAQYEQETGVLLYRTWGEQLPRGCRFYRRGSVSPDFACLIRITGIRAFVEGYIRFEWECGTRYLVGFTSGERICCPVVFCYG